ncbi:Uncharacterised protein [Haemophilus parahaemolyticus]|uniref:Uncharacterized protein n=1 Tax=Haemophilus parahaemolyticus TaxID=735 RepID=A0A377I279_HAEPH|nr:hypothetical protein [Haemophilus parahaemolyticus]STO64565.1 Uncharacterised protein [Haemophilus parahaemolyticus]
MSEQEKPSQAKCLAWLKKQKGNFLFWSIVVLYGFAVVYMAIHEPLNLVVSVLFGWLLWIGTQEPR